MLNAHSNNRKNYTSTNILSNSYFMYKDPLSVENPPEISLHPYIKNLEVNNNLPIHFLNKTVSIKSKVQSDLNETAFDRAEREVQVHIDNERKKAQKFDEGTYFIAHEMEKRKNEDIIKEDMEKLNLENKLRKLIHDTLKFSKKNTPLIAMMPQKFTDALNQIKKDRAGMKKKGGSVLNLSSDGSLNLSFRSSNSAGSVTKYESNAFLKALGLDLNNLMPGNINIKIDQAKIFIDKWSVKDKSKIDQIIRYKVVNEIMNVEERRSVQKLARINKRLKSYIDNERSKGKKRTDGSVAIPTRNESLSIIRDKNTDSHSNSKLFDDKEIINKSHQKEPNEKNTSVSVKLTTKESETILANSKKGYSKENQELGSKKSSIKK